MDNRRCTGEQVGKSVVGEKVQGNESWLWFRWGHPVGCDHLVPFCTKKGDGRAPQLSG